MLKRFEVLNPTPAECEIYGRLIDVQDAAFDRANESSKQHRHTTYFSLGAAAIVGFVIPFVDMANNRLPVDEGVRYFAGPALSLLIIGSIMVKTYRIDKERQRKEQADAKAQQQAVNP